MSATEERATYRATHIERALGTVGTIVVHAPTTQPPCAHPLAELLGKREYWGEEIKCGLCGACVSATAQALYAPGGLSAYLQEVGRVFGAHAEAWLRTMHGGGPHATAAATRADGGVDEEGVDEEGA